MMIRLFDLLLSFIGLILGLPLFIVIAIAIRLDGYPPLFFQARVGVRQNIFILVKFRTMSPETHSVATHLVNTSSITSFGHLLRKTKLDELPQLWNVLRGDMSLVGPRPCLANQHRLISERLALGVYEARPGITGLGQLHGVDMSTPELLAMLDAYMLSKLNLTQYFQYIFRTIVGVGVKKNFLG